LSIAFGGMLAAKSSKKVGWLKGGITGVVYVLFAFMISSLFGGSILMGSIIFSDILLGVIAGAVGGIIGVNV
jgi:putative membrane protein (TIGR04086 family)